VSATGRATVVALALFAACSRGGDGGGEVPRRVLLVTLDTTRADRLGCYGHAAARTPWLDSLARDGVRFERAWCAAPITLPSHATILTGVLPRAHGVRDNGLFVVGPSATTIAKVAHERGLATGAFVGSFVLAAKFGLAQGFDVYREPASGQFGMAPEVVQRPAASVVDDAIAWFTELAAKRRDASFLAWVHLYDPHAPHVAPPPFDHELADAYDGEIASCDAQLARLHAKLVELGLDRGLLEVVTADHGEGLGEHGEETHGLLLHDATMRVPLLVRGPGVAAGAVNASAVSNGQVAPTIAAWFGWPASVLPDSKFAPLPIAPEQNVPSSGTKESPAGDSPLLLETFLPFHLRRWHPLEAVVWHGSKLVHGRGDELFDLGADARETKDLAHEKPDVATALARQLRALRDATPPLAWQGSAALDDAERSHLRELGYAASAGDSSGADEDDALPDPRSAIGDAARQQKALALFQQARGLSGQDEALGQRGGGAAGANGATPADEAAQRQKAARAARAKELFEQAHALLLELAAKYPSDPSIAFDLGNVELSTGHAVDALPRFELAVRADPTSATNHYNLAVADANAGRVERAILEMEKAARCEPKLALPRQWLAMAHEHLGEFGRALWWARQVEPADARAVDALAQKAKAAGQSESPSPTYPPRDLLPAR
jgi:arylsulfatase A-like enzyme/Flp pilus assembly protein TadD